MLDPLLDPRYRIWTTENNLVRIGPDLRPDSIINQSRPTRIESLTTYRDPCMKYKKYTYHSRLRILGYLDSKQQRWLGQFEKILIITTRMHAIRVNNNKYLIFVSKLMSSLYRKHLPRLLLR